MTSVFIDWYLPGRRPTAWVSAPRLYQRSQWPGKGAATLSGLGTTCVTVLSPAVGVAGKALVLRLDHAEAVTGRSLHDPPGLDLLDPLGAKLFEARDLPFNIVRFDVQMYAAGVIHLLQQHEQVLLATAERDIFLAAGPFSGSDRSSEGIAPEFGRLRKIGRFTIDDDLAEPTTMHGCLPGAIELLTSVHTTMRDRFPGSNISRLPLHRRPAGGAAEGGSRPSSLPAVMNPSSETPTGAGSADHPP